MGIGLSYFNCLLIATWYKISAKCCGALKKAPAEIYERRSGRYPITGEMASESRRRVTNYLMYGCNGFSRKRPKSTPIAFWTEQDILRYLKEFSVPWCSVYGDIGEENGVLRTASMRRTGCVFCMFGVHREGPENRFTRLRRTHPKLWEYCVYSLGIGGVLEYMGVPCGMDGDNDGPGT
jgi:3'-phosphoadenosine 5'-phosphosulfate sulfotransferase (PAPS reductase)/FAD synthetase